MLSFSNFCLTVVPQSFSLPRCLGSPCLLPWRSCLQCLWSEHVMKCSLKEIPTWSIFGYCIVVSALTIVHEDDVKPRRNRCENISRRSGTSRYGCNSQNSLYHLEKQATMWCNLFVCKDAEKRGGSQVLLGRHPASHHKVAPPTCEKMGLW